MRILNSLYAAGSFLAAAFLVLIGLLTLAQIVGRMIGVIVPDAGDFAGFCMAAAAFLALAHTFRSGGHIRVNLLLINTSPRIRYFIEWWCLLCVALIGALFVAVSVKLTLDSYEFGDVSTGMVPVPLWIPQLSMVIGAVLFELAVLEEIVRVLRGGEPLYAKAEQSPDTYIE